MRRQEIPADAPADTPTDVPIDIPTNISSILPIGFSNGSDSIEINGRKFQNFSNAEAGQAILLLNSTVTGCVQQGAIPITLLHDTCNLGFFCPNSSRTAPPQYCPPSPECAGTRLSKGTCEPQGILEPVVCPAGFYCPEGGKQKIACEKGNATVRTLASPES